MEEKKILFSQRLKLKIEGTPYSFSVWGDKNVNFMHAGKVSA